MPIFGFLMMLAVLAIVVWVVVSVARAVSGRRKTDDSSSMPPAGPSAGTAA